LEIGANCSEILRLLDSDFSGVFKWTALSETKVFLSKLRDTNWALMHFTGRPPQRLGHVCSSGDEGRASVFRPATMFPHPKQGFDILSHLSLSFKSQNEDLTKTLEPFQGHNVHSFQTHVWIFSFFSFRFDIFRHFVSSSKPFFTLSDSFFVSFKLLALSWRGGAGPQMSDSKLMGSLCQERECIIYFPHSS